MEALPFKFPLMGISLTDEEAAGRKENLFMGKVGLSGIKCESDLRLPLVNSLYLESGVPSL